jgi:uncharacterized membrane protein YoaK (UPF0700 family)
MYLRKKHEKLNEKWYLKNKNAVKPLDINKVKDKKRIIINAEKKDNSEFLECEQWWIFAMLMCVSGFYGAFTYSIRGGIFCNAQSANFVLFAMALGKADWKLALYYLAPMSAYFLGAVLSETFALNIKKINLIRWDTLLIFIEIIVVIVLGFIPESAPYQISQIIINFICSMQYNTFRQANKIPMATTFCTNHLRQIGIGTVKWIRHRDGEYEGYKDRVLFHIKMLSFFVAGAIVSTILCRIYQGRAIWAADVILCIIFVDLLYADLSKERDMLERVPSGH